MRVKRSGSVRAVAAMLAEDARPSADRPCGVPARRCCRISSCHRNHCGPHGQNGSAWNWRQYSAMLGSAARDQIDRIERDRHQHDRSPGSSAGRAAAAGPTGMCRFCLRWRLGHTNRPDRKNISDIRQTSFHAQNRSKPNQRWLSMIGKALPIVGRRIEAVRLRRQRAEIGQDGMEPEHDQDDDGAQIAERQAGG